MIPGHLREPLGLTDVPARHFDTVLEGRATHQIGLDLGVVNAYPHLRHLVFSRTLDRLDDPAIELVRGDAVQRVRELKRQDGLDIWLCGGGALAGALRDEIDELHLKLHPVVLGSGVPLFADSAGDRTIDRYRLKSCRTFDSGVALLSYRRR